MGTGREVDRRNYGPVSSCCEDAIENTLERTTDREKGAAQDAGDAATQEAQERQEKNRNRTGARCTQQDRDGASATRGLVT